MLPCSMSVRGYSSYPSPRQRSICLRTGTGVIGSSCSWQFKVATQVMKRGASKAGILTGT